MAHELKDIIVRGAREHNLQDVNVTLPRNRLICFTGVSGSGKSSFAFDTLYAEGQRRYIESLSAYARQFLGQLQKPDVDLISGISPTISIQQKTSSWNPRSTVGTITQIHDYLRVLYARLGTQHCTGCGHPISARSREQLLSRIQMLPAQTQLTVLAPVVRGQKGEFQDLFEDMIKAGYVRARVDGEIVPLAEAPGLERHRKHDIEIVIDRLKLDPASRSRLAEAVDNALALGKGTLLVVTPSETLLLSSQYACTRCDRSFEPPSPQMFSFNSPSGMCPTCDGLGEMMAFDEQLLVPDQNRSFLDLAVEPMRKRIGRWRRHIYEGVARHVGFELDTPWRSLSPQARHALLYGTGDEHITFEWRWRGGIWRHGDTFEGIIAELSDKYRKAKAAFVRAYYEKYMRHQLCPDCKGARLNAQAMHVQLNGRTLSDIESAPVSQSRRLLNELRLSATEQLIAEQLLKEIDGRLGFLENVGLHYLTLDRPAPTLSGGESQRIRLASQIGSGLVGVLYILDEPSIGLHARDHQRLLESLEDLRDRGNTVVVVEHDEATMRAADLIIDFGPGPGVRGGRIVGLGSLDEIANEKDSLTAAYLTGREKIEVPPKRRSVDGADRNGSRRNRKKIKWLEVKGARQNNLKNIDAAIPLERFVCVTGVSGSGKSSLVSDIIREQLLKDLNGATRVNPGTHTRINGKQHLDKIIDIDQSPIGRTPRSNPATYIKVFDHIRDLYAKLPDARVRGYKRGRFSFNVSTGKKGGGRCEACEGNGSNRIEMDFLADIWVTCPVCAGRRFNRETLQILYKGKSISDVLNMDVQQALAHFEAIPRISAMLSTLHEVGLDYVKLGQSSTTLSGGEAQRIKLARELVKKSTGRTLYLLDEPTTGLHFDDIRRLLRVLHDLVDAGNTVLVIEHNLEIIKTADWIVDLGPEGGAGGGEIVAEGTPEHVAGEADSYTGEVLKPALGLSPVRRKKLGSKGPKSKSVSQKRQAANDRWIRVVGARQHNLKDVTVDIPHMQTTVFTGLSGSGKSSLAMDTLYTEGQRRYVESLSAYARQFLGQLQKPKVDHIEGLSPAIAIEQKTAGHSPRSTVGTVTEIYDYLRILYARLGEPHCPNCKRAIGTQSSEEIVERIMALPAETRILLLAPVHRSGSEKYTDLLRREKENGYSRVRIDGRVHSLGGDLPISERTRHAIELVVDRVSIAPRRRSRIADSTEQALAVGCGVIAVQTLPEDGSRGQELRFSQLFACNECGISYEELTPHHFSFNSRLGWCEACEGLGTQHGASLDAIVVNANKSLLEGALAGWSDLDSNPMLRETILAVLGHAGIDPHAAWRDLSPAQKRVLLHGFDADHWIEVALPGRKVTRKRKEAVPRSGLRVQWKGVFPAIDQATRASWHYRKKLEDLVTEIPCAACNGSRLKPLSREVRFGDRHRTLSMLEVCELPLRETLSFFERLTLNAYAKKVAGELLNEIKSRLQFLVDVGLDYVSLHRSAPTLSGGESQRIRLASQIGSGLTGVLYVLDEPTIGLHPRDNRRLIAALRKLRDRGNTLCIVEHDREVVDSADHILDFGPGAGSDGGQIVAQNTPAKLRKNKKSLTGGYLSGREAIFVPLSRRSFDPQKNLHLRVVGGRHNNLKEIDVLLPLGRFTVVTGVSGSGKSSLVNDILYKALATKLHRARLTPGGHDALLGLEHVDKVINIDQSPIGQSPTSNPATYTKVFEIIRELFTHLPESRIRGYTPNRFSFNRAGGRCESCWGLGQTCIEMHFLPDVWIDCEECSGRRYNAETLEVKYKGKSIADVLDMRVSEAMALFRNVPKVRAILRTLDDVGLGYIHLGQSSTTLSGGEAQRVKLAAELARPSTGKTIYILDEPTTGLHFEDLRKLLKVLHRLVDLGNTVICIEHNLDLIKTADWVIDLGPEAGELGGRIVAEGTPEHVATCTQSHTGRILEGVLKAGPTLQREIFTRDDDVRLQKQIDGKLDVCDAETDTELPWEKNGRRWHTQQCLASDGKRPRWEPQALEWLVDQLEKSSELEPADWKHRSRIELRAPRTSPASWFCHILTRGPWLLECNFRVAKRSFEVKRLASALDLKTLDEREDLPIYGQWRRVRRRVKRDFDELRVWIHDLDEIKTPAFRKFLKEAVDGYLRQIGRWQNDPLLAEPWKVDGKKWHLSQRSIASARRRQWKPQQLIELLGRFQKVCPDIELDWNHKTAVIIRHPRMEKAWGKIVTSNRHGLRIEIKSGASQLTPAKVDRLGKTPAIRRGLDHDVLSFTLGDPGALDFKQFRSVLREAEEALINGSTDS